MRQLVVTNESIRKDYDISEAPQQVVPREDEDNPNIVYIHNPKKAKEPYNKEVAQYVCLYKGEYEWVDLITTPTVPDLVIAE